MRHFTCDLCGLPIGEQRHVVQIEINVAYDPDELAEEDLDADHLAELASALEADDYDSEISDYSRQRREYDLCTNCRKQYAANPLGRVADRRIRFSEN